MYLYSGVREASCSCCMNVVAAPRLSTLSSGPIFLENGCRVMSTESEISSDGELRCFSSTDFVFVDDCSVLPIHEGRSDEKAAPWGDKSPTKSSNFARAFWLSSNVPVVVRSFFVPELTSCDGRCLAKSALAISTIAASPGFSVDLYLTLRVGSLPFAVRFPSVGPFVVIGSFLVPELMEAAGRSSAVLSVRSWFGWLLPDNVAFSSSNVPPVVSFFLVPVFTEEEGRSSANSALVTSK
mmetsp:Transcript_35457/g.79565  ORF Transcript_35457/g.79565 Transcript_35457/m.79565 type:complete len:239 (-) Transcript_35457:386-1102(-)